MAGKELDKGIESWFDNQCWYSSEFAHEVANWLAPELDLAIAEIKEIELSEELSGFEDKWVAVRNHKVVDSDFILGDLVSRSSNSSEDQRVEIDSIFRVLPPGILRFCIIDQEEGVVHGLAA